MTLTQNDKNSNGLGRNVESVTLRLKTQEGFEFDISKLIQRIKPVIESEGYEGVVITDSLLVNLNK